MVWYGYEKENGKGQKLDYPRHGAGMPKLCS